MITQQYAEEKLKQTMLLPMIQGFARDVRTWTTEGGKLFMKLELSVTCIDNGLFRPIHIINDFCCFCGDIRLKFFVLTTCFKLKIIFTIMLNRPIFLIRVWNRVLNLIVENHTACVLVQCKKFKLNSLSLGQYGCIERVTQITLS